MNPLDIVLIIAGVGYVLARRTIGEMIELKRLAVVPVVLTIIGLSHAAKLHDVGAAGVALAAVGVLLSVVIGAARGATVHLGVRDGHVWMRYTVTTILLWVANFAVKGAMLPVEHAAGGSAVSTSNATLLLSIGLGILAETAVVMLRAMRLEGVLVWEKGKDGAPHRTSPAVDKARAWLDSTDGLTSVRRSLSKRDW